MGNDDLTLEVLKQIRDELRDVRDETRANGVRLDRTNERLDRMAHEQIRHATAIVGLEGRMGDVVSELVKLNARFDNILGTVGAAGRDTAARVDKLEERFDAMEKRLG